MDGLLGYAVAMAVGVAVFSRASDGRPDPWPAYVFALGFGLILLIRRRYPVQVLIITSLGICAYYALQYPPIGLALPIATALFSAAEAGYLRISILVSVSWSDWQSIFKSPAGERSARCSAMSCLQ
jgi:hypothetical protein